MTMLSNISFNKNVFSNNLLSNYVKKNALYAISLAVLGLWLLQVVFSYLGELDSLSDTYNMIDALTYIFYKSPYFLEQFIPTGALLGSVVGLGLLANNSELVVMRASGISNLRLVGWVMQPAILFVLLSLAINQFILPKSNHLADMVNEKDKGIEDVLAVNGYWSVQPTYLDYTKTKKLDEKAVIPDNHISKIETATKKATGTEIIYINYADIKGNIEGVKRWQLDQAGNLLSTSIAVNGSYIGFDSNRQDPESKTINYQWQLKGISTLNINKSLSSESSTVSSDIINLPIEPKSVYLLTKEAEDLSLTQLFAHGQFMRSQDKRSLSHELAFWQKLLSPFAILSLVIVACSFVFGSLRTQSLGSRVVVALVFGLFFSYIQDLTGFISLATGISPFIMVAIPVLVCAILGIYLLQRQS